LAVIFVKSVPPVVLDFRCKKPTLGAKATLGAKPKKGSVESSNIGKVGKIINR